MKRIPLTQGKVALVDDEDFERINQHKWCVAKNNSCWYALRAIKKKDRKSTMYMHRIIMNAQSGQMIDHINGNGLDNRKVNLRFCSREQNLANMKSRQGVSKFKGVSWYRQTKKWVSRIELNGHRHYLGQFDNELNAALAYDIAAKKFFGEFAKLNFPKEENGKTKIIIEKVEEE